MLPSLGFVPRHAGQPGVRAKTCASLVSASRHKTWASLVFEQPSVQPAVRAKTWASMGQPGVRAKPAGQPGVRAMLASVVTCWPAWCSCQDMLASLVLLPRHAGQPGVRAKTCWPAWCSCQDMLASLVFVPKHGPAWCLCQDMLASLVFVPRHGTRHAGQPGFRAKTCWPGFRAKTWWPAWCLCREMGQPGVLGVRAGQPGVRHGPAARAKTCWPCWPAGCSCQDMLASLVFVPRHAGQPGVRAKIWTSLVFVPRR